MATVERCEGGRSEPLGGGDDRGVDRTERKIAVPPDELGNP
jgi:hypothetical protein